MSKGGNLLSWADFVALTFWCFVHRFWNCLWQFLQLQVENIMLDSRGHAKIIDFGLATQLQSNSLLSAHAGADHAGSGSSPGSPTTGSLGEPLSPTGSLLYMPPELLKDKVGHDTSTFRSTVLISMHHISYM
jgi:serine/threonine protein kinase